MIMIIKKIKKWYLDINKFKNESNKLFTDGIKEFKNKNYDKAIKLWNEVLKIDPYNESVNTYIKYAERAKEVRGNKSNNIEKKEKPDNLMYNAITEYRNNNFKKAIELWKELLKNDPNNEQAKKYIERAENKLKIYKNVDKTDKLIYDAIDEYKNNNFEKTIELCNEVLKINPRDIIAKEYINRSKYKLNK